MPSVRGDLLERACRHDEAMAAFTEAAARSANAENAPYRCAGRTRTDCLLSAAPPRGVEAAIDART